MSFGKEEKKTSSEGPWGGEEGSAWNDGVYSGIKQIVISHGTAIDSIQFEYDNKGTSVWSHKHGGEGGTKLDKVKLDHPTECLTSIHGHYGKLSEWGPIFIRSLTFITNKKQYGPFGVERGTSFACRNNESKKIVGFHGKSGWYLDSIGVHLKPILKEEKPTKGSLVQGNYNVNNNIGPLGYSVIQGQASGGGYDIVVAVRQKDDKANNNSNPLNTKKIAPTPKISDVSSSSSDDEGNNKRPTTQKGKIVKLPIPKGPRPEEVLSYEPWGGAGGTQFDDGIYTGIRQIYLSRNIGIVYMKVQYDLNGQAIWSSRHGGTGGFKTDKIVFDFPYEVLTRISGTYGALMYMGPLIIKSLTFYTNKGKHGPFGDEQGPSFTSIVNEGKIVGFHGREGFFLDAIGIHVAKGEVKPPNHFLSDAVKQTRGEFAEIEHSPWSNKLIMAKRGQTEEVNCAIVKEPASCGSGPWGGDGGRPWDDGVFSGIKQIVITRSEGICSIQIEYDRNGQSVWSVRHGGSGGTTTHRVKLECPHEVLTCVSGYFGPIGTDGNLKVLKSLTFHTSRGKYGPFGEEIGTFFTSTKTEGKVLGFHGRSSAYLDALGVHMQHWLGNRRAFKPSMLKFLKSN